MGNWRFDQPKNCAVVTLRHIADRSQPILHVTHDREDHGWQFLGWSDAQEEEAVVVSLESIISLDESLLELADLPPGWHAWRHSIDEPWTREPNPHDELA